jgi:hypothetical protein
MANARINAKIGVIGLVAATVQLAALSSAPAMEPAYCEKYARTAVAQTHAAQENKCFTLSSRRWHLDRGKHYDWCLTATLQQVRRDWNGRTARLNRCTGGCPGHRCDEGW